MYCSKQSVNSLISHTIIMCSGINLYCVVVSSVITAVIDEMKGIVILRRGVAATRALRVAELGLVQARRFDHDVLVSDSAPSTRGNRWADPNSSRVRRPLP